LGGGVVTRHIKVCLLLFASLKQKEYLHVYIFMQQQECLVLQACWFVLSLKI